jgi:hypothetical protein
MTRQTQFEFQYDQNGKLKSGRSVTKSIQLDYDYYGRWFRDPTNASKMIKQGNSYYYPGVQFASYREFKRSSTFKQRAEKVAEDYVSQRTGLELNTNSGYTVGQMVEMKHGEDWMFRWGNRFVRRLAKVLRNHGMK